MRNNGLVSIGVGTWRRPRTTSLSILLLFSLCISQSDKHSIIKIALQSELEASLLLPDDRHVFFWFLQVLLAPLLASISRVWVALAFQHVLDCGFVNFTGAAACRRLAPQSVGLFSAANLRSRQQHSQRRLVHSINIYGLARKETLHNHNFSQG